MPTYNQVIISSGHSINCQGASGYVNEVTEARKVVDRVTEILQECGKSVAKYHDTSYDVNQNLRNIVNFHNNYGSGIDVSVHFNAYQTTSNPMGVEVLYTGNGNGKIVAAELSKAIAEAGGFKNRGAKERNNLYFLRNTDKTSVLIEVCFCDSKRDTDLYRENFEAICRAIVKTLTGASYAPSKPQPQAPSGQFFRVVTGSYKVRANAEEQVSNVKAKGIDCFMAYEDGYFRVIAGSYRERANAVNQVALCKSKGIDAFISIK